MKGSYCHKTFMNPHRRLWYFLMMEDSNPTAAKEQPSSLVNHYTVVIRALASAAVFGAMGWGLGRWLGRRANPYNSNVVESIMKWGMSIFSGTLAAYCSLKVSEPSSGDRLDQTVSAQNTSATENASKQANQTRHDVPRAHIEAPTGELQGNLRETGALQR
jgi:hypothetical protein